VVLYLVEKLDEDDEYNLVRVLKPEEEAAFRTVKSGGKADEDMRALYLYTVGSARDNGHWFMCDCRFEGGRGPAIIPRVDTPERIDLVNRPGSSQPHAGGCIFVLTEDEEDNPRRADGHRSPRTTTGSTCSRRPGRYPRPTDRWRRLRRERSRGCPRDRGIEMSRTYCAD